MPETSASICLELCLRKQLAVYLLQRRFDGPMGANRFADSNPPTSHRSLSGPPGPKERPLWVVGGFTCPVFGNSGRIAWFSESTVSGFLNWSEFFGESLSSGELNSVSSSRPIFLFAKASSCEFLARYENHRVCRRIASEFPSSETPVHLETVFRPYSYVLSPPILINIFWGKSICQNEWPWGSHFPIAGEKSTNFPSSHKSITFLLKPWSNYSWENTPFRGKGKANF